MIAEDEDDILTYYKSVLEQRGHKVILTNNGEECLIAYKQEMALAASRKKTNKKKKERKRKVMATTQTIETTETEITNEQIEDDDYYYDDDDNDNANVSPFDVVILDHKMPKKTGLEIAKEILEINPEQRIIFASAYVRETLEESVKHLRKVVELIQKPFETNTLIEAIEDKEIYKQLKILMLNIKEIEKEEYQPTKEQIRDLFKSVRKIEKGRLF